MEFINNHKKAMLITVTIACLITVIITLRYRGNPTFLENMLGYVITPVQGAFTGIGKFFEDKLIFFSNISELQEENEKLKAEVETLRFETNRLSQVEKEIEKLSKLLEIDNKYADLPKVGAEIIAFDGGNWYDNFTINKGTNDGLDKNMAVIAEGGLVGRIVESGANYSKVVLLVDDASSVSAKSTRTEDIGYVRGDMQLTEKGFCRMDYINITAQIMEGDEIVTSQLSDIYPPGIVIGYVKEVKTDTNRLTKYAIIQPLVDFKHLQTVLVITKKPTGTEEGLQ